MNGALLALAVGLLAGLAPALSVDRAWSVAAQDEVMRSAHHDYRVVTVVDGLVNPWSMTFLPGGDMLVTERPGRLRIVRNGVLLPDPVPGAPEVLAHLGQDRGLMEVAAHPEFASNRIVYLCYSKPLGDDEDSFRQRAITAVVRILGFRYLRPGSPTVHTDRRRPATMAVVRGTFENDRFTPVDEIFEAASRGAGQYGCKLAFDADGYLFLTVGDRDVYPSGDLAAHPAQDVSNHQGTIVRLHDDGRVPEDNPFVGQYGAQPEIWSYGHRNPQGLAVHPQTGAVWLTEHGPQGGDEVNVSEPGKNYGWPVIGYGVHYGGRAIHAGTHAEGMEQPLHVWVPSIAPSGLLFYTGDKFPEWQGSLFAGGLIGQRIDRLSVDGGRVVASETLLRGVGRVRDIRQGPDGFIYVAIESRQGDETPIVRLEPADR